MRCTFGGWTPISVHHATPRSLFWVLLENSKDARSHFFGKFAEHAQSLCYDCPLRVKRNLVDVVEDVEYFSFKTPTCRMWYTFATIISII